MVCDDSSMVHAWVIFHLQYTRNWDNVIVTFLYLYSFFLLQVHEISVSIRMRKKGSEHSRWAAGSNRWKSPRRSSLELRTIRHSNADTIAVSASISTSSNGKHIIESNENFIFHTRCMQRIKPNKCSHTYQQQQRSPGMMQQLSPLSLVTQQAVNGNHSSHRMMGHTQLPTGGDYNERMLEYIKLLQNNKSERRKFLIHDLML